MRVFVVLTSVGLAWLRLAGEKSPAFQAAAHVVVGALLGAYLAGGRRLYLAAALALSAVECFAFSAGQPAGPLRVAAVVLGAALAVACCALPFAPARGPRYLQD